MKKYMLIASFFMVDTTSPMLTRLSKLDIKAVFILSNFKRTCVTQTPALSDITHINSALHQLHCAFPSKVLTRFMKDFNISDYNKADRLKHEWIRYALLTKINEKPLGMFSKDVDNLWHTFLLFSKDYHAFCTNLPDPDQFLHHTPHDDAMKDRCQRPQKIAFLAAYQKLYGQSPDLSIWTALKPCVDTDNNSFQECQEIGSVGKTNCRNCCGGGGGCGCGCG